MKRLIIVFGVLTVTFVLLLTNKFDTLGSNNTSIDTSSEDDGEYYSTTTATPVSSAAVTKKKKDKLIKVDTNPASIGVLVNRDYLMDKDYIPSDLVVPTVRFSFYGICEKSYMRQVAASAIENMFTAAQGQGYYLKVVSAYRSYARQQEIYTKNVTTRGKTSTDKVSAKPGSSEHQTGLAIDISTDTVGCAIDASFGQSEEGKWVAKNAHKYGFIIRYPKNKTNITGYEYEPWHVRYVGKHLATYLYKKHLTLEEYYETTTQANKINIKVDDTLGVEDEEAQMTSAPTPNPTYNAVTPTPTSTAKTKKKNKVKKTEAPVKTKKPTVTKTPKPEATEETEEIVTEEPQATQTPQTDTTTTSETVQ